MKRRNFIKLIGGTATWPLAARAQLKLVRLGNLKPGRPADPAGANLRRQLLLGLRDLGYIEGRHFQLEQRSADGGLESLPGLARELAMKDGSTPTIDYLVTRVYEKIDGRWLIVSHHVQPKPQ